MPVPAQRLLPHRERRKCKLESPRVARNAPAVLLPVHQFLPVLFDQIRTPQRYQRRLEPNFVPHSLDAHFREVFPLEVDELRPADIIFLEDGAVLRELDVQLYPLRHVVDVPIFGDVIEVSRYGMLL